MKPDYMLVAPPDVTEEQMRQARDEWLSALADGKPPILRKGWRIESLAPVGYVTRPSSPATAGVWPGWGLVLAFIMLIAGFTAWSIADILVGVC